MKAFRVSWLQHKLGGLCMTTGSYAIQTYKQRGPESKDAPLFYTAAMHVPLNNFQQTLCNVKPRWTGLWTVHIHTLTQHTARDLNLPGAHVGTATHPQSTFSSYSRRAAWQSLSCIHPFTVPSLIITLTHYRDNEDGTGKTVCSIVKQYRLRQTTKDLLKLWN